jgi:hypothetical protein
MVETGEGRTPRPEKANSGCPTSLAVDCFLAQACTVGRTYSDQPVFFFDGRYRHVSAASRLIVTSPRSPGEIRVACQRLASVDVFFVSYFFATSLTS